MEDYSGYDLFDEPDWNDSEDESEYPEAPERLYSAWVDVTLAVVCVAAILLGFHFLLERI